MHKISVVTTRIPSLLQWAAYRLRETLKSLVTSLAIILLLGEPTTIQAQPAAKVFRIGFIGYSDPISPENSNLQAFRRGLRELGLVEGKHVVIEARSAEGRAERIPELVAELLGLKVDVLLAGSTLVAVAAKDAATLTPIVFAGVADPVGSRLVASLSRPGGNVTGIAVGVSGAGFTGKCLELFKEAVPGLSHIAVLMQPANPFNAQYVEEAQAAARTLKLRLEVLGAGNPADLERALAAIGASGAQGIFIMPGSFLTGNSAKIAQFAASRRLPGFHFSRRFTDSGVLISYGASLADSYKKAAMHVDKILKGAKPGDLPVEQPTHFEMVINLKTANAMGLKIPLSVLLRTDHIIE